MSLLKRIIHLAVPAPAVESFQNYLFVGPHPDDIEIGAGASAAKLVSMGKKVTFLICTDGRFGTEHIDLGADELAALRREEARRSAAVLGVSDVRFLDFSDGALYRIEALRHALAVSVGEIKPDILLCPDPDVDKECHPDHLNVGRLCKELAFFAPFEGIMAENGAESAPVSAIAFYMTARPNRYVKTAGFFHRQLDALFSCHLSQYPSGCAEAQQLRTYLRLRSRLFGLRRLSSAAEGFRVLDKTNMHCLPE